MATKDIDSGFPSMKYSLGGRAAFLTWSTFFLYLGIALVVARGSSPLIWGGIPLAMLYWILRNSSWSPFFIGPTLSFGPDGIYGRSCLGQEAWHIAWSEFDRADWGRNGIFVYRKTMKAWEMPYRQGGPFNYSRGRVTKEISDGKISQYERNKLLS